MKNIFFVLLFSILCSYSNKINAQNNDSHLIVIASILPKNYIKSDTNLFFTVQIGAYINKNKFFENLENITITKEKKLNIYRLGEFPSYQEAKEYKKMVLSVCRDAFIVPIKNGKRIHIKEALKESLEI